MQAIVGGIGSGKTAALVEHVRTLLDQGVPASSIVLAAASRDGAANLRRRVHAVCGEAANGMRTTSLRAWELAVLAAGAGRAPRLMLDVEQSIVVADLKAAGVDAAALTGLLDRMAAGWGDGAPVDDDVARRLEVMVHTRGALLPQEVAYRAWQAVAHDAELAAQQGASHVVIDDANGLSRSAVVFARELATTKLVVAGNPAWPNALFDPGARPRAWREEADEVVELGEAPVPRRSTDRTAVKWLSLEEELAGATTATLLKVRDQVARQRERGREELGQGTATGAAGDDAHADELLPFCAAQVAVAVAGKPYATPLVRALEAREQPVSLFLERHPIGGDPRRRKTCPELAAFAALGILADESDVASWRTWVALGHADLASAAWRALEGRAAACGRSVLETLAELAETVDCSASDDTSEPFAGAKVLVEAYRQGCALRACYEKRVGFGLIKAVDPTGSRAFLELCEPLGGTESADQVFAHVCANAFDRHYSPDSARVRIGCPASFMGMEPRSTLALGCNEGVMPAAPAGTEVAAAEAHALAHALLCAREESVASFAQRCPVETARKLGAHYRRTRRDGDEELAVLAPSPVLADFGHDAPPTLSGQQYASVVLGVRP